MYFPINIFASSPKIIMCARYMAYPLSEASPIKFVIVEFLSILSEVNRLNIPNAISATLPEHCCQLSSNDGMSAAVSMRELKTMAVIA